MSSDPEGSTNAWMRLKLHRTSQNINIRYNFPQKISNPTPYITEKAEEGSDLPKVPGPSRRERTTLKVP